MSKMPAVSERSKKNEILDAYHSVLEKLKAQQTPNSREQVKRVEENKIVQKSQTLSSEGVIQALAEIKTHIGKALDKLEAELLERYKEFSELQQAIVISKKELESIHQVISEADTLAVFIQAHKNMRQQLEEDFRKKQLDLESEIAERKSLWEKEKAAFDQTRKENEKVLKIERERENEEYQYRLKLTRQKERDKYESERGVLEKEMKEMKEQTESEFARREKQLLDQEQELFSLRKQVEDFPTTLSTEIEQVRVKTEKKVQNELQFQMELSKQETEGERKLYEQKVSSLESKIKELEGLVAQLNKKADEANKQVQGIAFKAIEGASNRVPYTIDAVSPKPHSQD